MNGETCHLHYLADLEVVHEFLGHREVGLARSVCGTSDLQLLLDIQQV